MKWLTENRFSHYDAIWMMGFGALISHNEYLFGFCLLLFGAMTSGALTAHVRLKESGS